MRLPLSMLGFLLSLSLACGGPALAQSAGRAAAQKQNLDLPFDAIGEREDEEEEPVDSIVFCGQVYEADGVFFCLDKSSSMNTNNRWKKVQQETAKSIGQFSERVQFGICFFDASQVLFPPSGRPAEANPAMKSAAISMVMSTQTGHGNCYKEALLRTLMMADQSTSKRRIIICMGDGEVGCGGSSDDPNIILAQVKARNVNRIKINAVCVQSDAGEPFLRSLAAQNGGTYARVN